MSDRQNDAVYLWRTDYQEFSDIDYASSAREFLEALHPDLPPDGTIVFKPNVTWGIEPQSGIIVHPEFVGGLLDSMVRRGVDSDRLWVTEGNVPLNEDGTPTFISSGYTAMTERRGAHIVHVDDDRVVDTPVPGGVVFDALPLPSALTEAALIVNVPIAKCHNLSLTTLSMKNMMGMVAEPMRHFCRWQEPDVPLMDQLFDMTDRGFSLIEERFCHKLSDLASAVKSLPAKKIHLVSGILGRDGTGFGNGENYLLNLLAASENPLHVDAVVTHLMGIDPLKTPYLNIGAERGLGTNRVGEIEIIDLRTDKNITMDELERSVHQPAFVPLVRSSRGYMSRFRSDGSLVPWQIDHINQQRNSKGLEPIPFD